MNNRKLLKSQGIELGRTSITVGKYSTADSAFVAIGLSNVYNIGSVQPMQFTVQYFDLFGSSTYVQKILSVSFSRFVTQYIGSALDKTYIDVKEVYPYTDYPDYADIPVYVELSNSVFTVTRADTGLTGTAYSSSTGLTNESGTVEFFTLDDVDKTIPLIFTGYFSE